ncbi:MAG: hypothetical protein F9K30_21515 [Dechloromonas sp.]|nr:MAG: hypothetical protein F9K30_21515 [Dechloromonas sp.]
MRENTRARNENVSDDERLRRIAELLCKAILPMQASEAVATPAAGQSKDEPVKHPAFVDPHEVGEDNRVLSYLRFVGHASPAQIRGTLGLSRTGTHRVLFRLSRSGKIAASGRTRNILYQLSQSAPCADKILLN